MCELFSIIFIKQNVCCSSWSFDGILCVCLVGLVLGFFWVVEVQEQGGFLQGVGIFYSKGCSGCSFRLGCQCSILLSDMGSFLVFFFISGCLFGLFYWLVVMFKWVICIRVFFWEVIKQYLQSIRFGRIRQEIRFFILLVQRGLEVLLYYFIFIRYIYLLGFFNLRDCELKLLLRVGLVFQFCSRVGQKLKLCFVMVFSLDLVI